MKEKDCIKIIASKRDDILKSTFKHKQDIHEEVDHPGLKEISQAFDIRSWTLDIKDDDERDEKERKIDEFLLKHDAVEVC